ncbi:MAG: hypothetical protein ACYC3X_22870 [Pirellulaceae bacterium]
MYSNQLGAFGLDPVHCAIPAVDATEQKGESRHVLIRWLAKAAIILANGFIVFFFSERVFWSFPRPNDSLAELLLTWFVYSLLGWILLILVRRYRIANFLPLFLAGAIYGWITEGVVVDTLYGGPDDPFPLSVSFTALSWHALLSVGIGWYLLPKALTAPTLHKTIRISLAVGFCWGLWAVWWPNELGQQDQASIWNFAGHALTCSVLFIGAWVLLGRARSSWFQAGRLETGFLFGLVAVVFLVARIPARPSAALILPPLLLLAAIGLGRGAGREGQRDLLDECLGRIRLTNAFALVLIPLTAIATYAPFRLLELYPATDVVLYLVTMPLGFWFFFQALRNALVPDG